MAILAKAKEEGIHNLSCREEWMPFSDFFAIKARRYLPLWTGRSFFSFSDNGMYFKPSGFQPDKPQSRL